MDASEGLWSAAHDPLASSDPAHWDRLIEAVDPASLLVVLSSRMGSLLRDRTTPDDLLQETLLHAWRSRASHRWMGLTAFRRWLLKIAEHRLHDLADRERAQKRGEGRRALSIDGPRADGSEHRSVYAGPVTTTTPSRVARDHERAESLEIALETLPEELRSVVYRKLFLDQSLTEIADGLEITVAAVRHRFRKGALIYHRSLQDRADDDG